MTLTKNYENYTVQDKFEQFGVNGSVEKTVNGGINISINIDNGSSAFFSKDTNNHINYSFSFNEDQSIIAYVQELVSNILQELADGGEQENAL